MLFRSATGAWEIHLHDSEDGAAVFSTPARTDVLTKLQEVISCAPFHLNELPTLGFRLG